MTTATTILALILALALIKIWRLSRHNRNQRHCIRDLHAAEYDYLTRIHRLEASNKAKRDEIRLYDLASRQDRARYYIVRSLCGYCAVYRLVNVEGREFAQLIHRFTDPDTDFNHLLAEELCDNLNSLPE